jgi:Ferritin-like
MNRDDVTTTSEARDLTWLKRMLQTAIAIEASTLPPYIAAMFSLEVQNYTAYNLIRSVVMEEMVHMAIASNTLAALGGSPQIASLPLRYPMQGLPGGAEADLYIGLTQLSRPQLANFMRIERPVFMLDGDFRDGTCPTIGEVYRIIRDGIVSNASAVRATVGEGGRANQVGDNIGFATIIPSPDVDPVDQLLHGIDVIVEQGEGASRENLFTGADSEDEESHYARFAELYYGARYDDPPDALELTIETEPQFFQGRPVPWPRVINTLAVPADGYRRLIALDPNAAAVTADLEAFDRTYSDILVALDAVWNGPARDSWKTLGGSVREMVALRVLSCFNIMRHQIPNALVRRLPELYPGDIEFLDANTNLDTDVFYGPRFENSNAPGGPGAVVPQRRSNASSG